VLIGARAVQAVGAAFIMPSTLSTVNAVFRGKYRAAAFGVWGAVISGAAAVGPLAGGALTQWASWHWIFLVNLPLGVLVFIAALFTLPETRGEKKRPGIDVDGAQLSAIGFGALVFAVIEGPDLGWWTPKSDLTVFGWVWPKDAAISAAPVAFAVAAIALVLFVIWERHREKVQRAALLDLDLFSFSTFSWGNLTAAMVAVGEFAIIFVLPLYLINALGLDVMGAGLVLAAMAVGAFLSGAAARHLAARFGAPGTVLIGLGLEVAGVLALALLLGPATPGRLIAIPLVVYGLGLGLASAQLTGTVLQDIPSKSPARDRPPRAPSGRSAPPSAPHSPERHSRSPSRSLSPPPSATRDSPARRRTRLPTPRASPRAPRSCSSANREAVAVSAIRPRRLSTPSRADSPMRPAGRS
jgi:predicted MFS family arabinose efflux permease